MIRGRLTTYPRRGRPTRRQAGRSGAMRMIDKPTAAAASLTPQYGVSTGDDPAGIHTRQQRQRIRIADLLTSELEP
jgi:hypothetical protein